MAGEFKFPLKMKDGAMVRNLQALKEHFDLESVLRYYVNGKLTLWLENYYYDDKARQVRELEPSDPEFKRKLCEILGIQSADVAKMDNPYHSLSSMVREESISDAIEKDRRLNELKRYTDDDELLASIDHVAFTQEDLEHLLAEKVHRIYLLGEQFTVSSGAAEWLHSQFMTAPEGLYLTFTGVNHPTVDIAERQIGQSMRGGDGLAYMKFENVELTARALFLLAEVSHDPEEAFSHYQEAAEKGLAEAQERLGHCYRHGEGVKKDLNQAFAWSFEAAMQENAIAQMRLGIFYEKGYGVNKDLSRAAAWYSKAAEQGHAKAQFYLGCCYLRGSGVIQSEETAIEWLKKAYDQGIQPAGQVLIKIAPQLFRLSEVVLCAAGGKENIASAQLDTSARTIGIAVKDRNKVDKTILKRYGAAELQITPIYYEHKEKKISPQKALGLAARAYFGLWAYDIGKAVLRGKPLLDICTNKAVSEDLGWGFLRFCLKTITAEMLEDFNRTVQKSPDTP